MGLRLFQILLLYDSFSFQSNNSSSDGDCYYVLWLKRQQISCCCVLCTWRWGESLDLLYLALLSTSSITEVPSSNRSYQIKPRTTTRYKHKSGCGIGQYEAVGFGGGGRASMTLYKATETPHLIALFSCVHGKWFWTGMAGARKLSGKFAMRSGQKKSLVQCRMIKTEKCDNFFRGTREDGKVAVLS